MWGRRGAGLLKRQRRPHERRREDKIRGKGLGEVEMLSVSAFGGQDVLIPLPCWDSQPGGRVQSVTVADTESWAVGRWGLVCLGIRTRKMQTMVAPVLEPVLTSRFLD